MGSAVAVTLVAVLGGVGAFPESSTPAAARFGTLAGAASAPTAQDQGRDRERAAAGKSRGVAGSGERFSQEEGRRTARASRALEVPAGSGAGRRVVFDMGEQRVWLVAGSGRVRRTYPVSGSLTDNLQPGTYEVWSRSLRAWGIDDSGTMRYMVRFAHGERAAIGFHDIPVKDGRRVQGRDDLGVPQSHGCIRQWRPDAEALWDFAPLGTEVVVVA